MDNIIELFFLLVLIVGPVLAEALKKKKKNMPPLEKQSPGGGKSLLDVLKEEQRRLLMEEPQQVMTPPASLPAMSAYEQKVTSGENAVIRPLAEMSSARKDTETVQAVEKNDASKKIISRGSAYFAALRTRIIWAEILAPPLSKRGSRKMTGVNYGTGKNL